MTVLIVLRKKFEWLKEASASSQTIQISSLADPALADNVSELDHQASLLYWLAASRKHDEYKIWLSRVYSLLTY